MSPQDSAALQTAAHGTSVQKRAHRALTERMTALTKAPGLYTVIGQHSGPEYTVDTHDGRCTCPDKQYNLDEGEACKHELRVRYATQELEIPDWIPEDIVDPLLGAHVNQVATDGSGTDTTGPTNEDTTTGDDRPDNLEFVDTGAGCLVFEQLTEERTAGTVIVAKRLLGFYHVQDWDVITEAVMARGHSAGDVLHLPEFDSIKDAHTAADRDTPRDSRSRSRMQGAS